MSKSEGGRGEEGETAEWKGWQKVSFGEYATCKVYDWVAMVGG